MHRTCLAAVTIIGLINGCSQAAEPTPTRQHYLAHSRMREFAEQEAKRGGSVLVAFSESDVEPVSYAAFVTYAEASENAPATCRLQIAESVSGRIRVVEDTDHLLFCSTVVDPEIERKQLFVNASRGAISIHEQRDKKSSTFEFVKDDGSWVVSKVAFSYPEQDGRPGEIRVINEQGEFTGSTERTRVSDFNARSANLIRKVVR
jgi:hypothetical protein